VIVFFQPTQKYQTIAGESPHAAIVKRIPFVGQSVSMGLDRNWTIVGFDIYCLENIDTICVAHCTIDRDHLYSPDFETASKRESWSYMEWVSSPLALQLYFLEEEFFVSRLDLQGRSPLWGNQLNKFGDMVMEPLPYLVSDVRNYEPINPDLACYSSVIVSKLEQTKEAAGVTGAIVLI
jgi:hypothetical protein